MRPTDSKLINNMSGEASSFVSFRFRAGSRVLVALLALAFAGAAAAAVTGKIAGTVTDPSGGGIPMVSVSITNTAQGPETKVTADEHGDYIFPSVPVGHLRHPF